MRGHGQHDPHHPVAPPPVDEDDPRDSKQLSPRESADLCAGCVACCSYITVQVDAPRAAWEYDQWIWALHHEGIQMYVERPERWFLHVTTRCGRLDERGRCSIHGRHPVLCREYDPRWCERRLPLGDIRAWFHDAHELEAWVERERPAHWARLKAFRDGRPDAPAAEARDGRPAPSAAGLIPVAALVGAAAPQAGSGAAAIQAAPARRPARRAR
jgi:Fe-S-cluster containining protein